MSRLQRGSRATRGDDDDDDDDTEHYCYDCGDYTYACAYCNSYSVAYGVRSQYDDGCYYE